MKFTTISLPDVSPQNLERWKRLSDRAIEANPNADPRFLHASVGFGLAAEDIELAIVESGDEFALVMPFTRARRLSGAPVPYLTTSSEFIFVHASKNHPLVAPEDPAAALRALFAGLRAAGMTDLVNLTVFPASGPLFAALEVLRREGTVRIIERARDRRAYARWDDLDPTNAEWQKDSGRPLDYPMPHLSKSSQRGIRRSVKQIEALAGAPLAISRRDDDPELIDEFLELQATGWKGDAAKGGPQFRRLGREEWFRNVLRAFHADGRLQVWHVTAGDETVYIILTVKSGGAMFGFHDVYSERFQRYSPGTVGRLALVGAIMRDSEAPAFDPCMEPIIYPRATSMFPSYREYVDLLVAGPSLRARTMVTVFPAVRRLRALMRRSQEALWNGRGRLPGLAGKTARETS